METPVLDPTDYQGGKRYGEVMEKWNGIFQEINQEFVTDDTYKDVEDLEEKLQSYKTKFLEFDLDHNGEIGEMSLKLMMEKMGQAKTHLEITKMIKEIDTTNSGTISYKEFLWMMLGGKSTILKLILFFESMGKEEPAKTGIPPKRTLDSLP